jgi:2-oxoglutarate dehydrogenase E2 component (dihydrolipoamide succinyltransferase)
MAEIVKATARACVSDEVIAQIDTEARPRSRRRAGRPRPPRRRRRPPRGCRRSKADVAMPAAAKLMADNSWPPARSAAPARTAASPRATCSARSRRRASRAAPRRGRCRAAPAVAKPLPPVAAPVASNLGDRPEQRVPMSRLRARVAERLLQSQATNAILTTFNEVNMAPVMEMRKRSRRSSRRSTASRSAS